MIQQKGLHFINMKSAMIVFTVFALWFSVYFSERVETILSYVLILSFGVLHGANDIHLIWSTYNNENLQISRNKVIALYLSVVLAILVLFSFSPLLAFTFFILISGYHFGEQHWEKSFIAKSIWDKAVFLLYGLFILFMLFYIKTEQVIPVIMELTDYNLTPYFLKMGFLSLGVLLMLLFGLKYVRREVNANLWEELFMLGVFFVIFKTASLLWGFCIYFVVWHSIPSLMDQMNYLYGRSDWGTFKDYLKTSWPYWIVSLVGLFGLYWFLGDNHQFFLTVLIYFLAAITFPHVIVMSRLEKK
nr:Brp/Blh family beta-carotene 15,15'-dioxygenase [Allomuricauda sp.]